jgi:choloylglycine hydrolase
MAEYTPTTAENQSRSMSSIDFSTWILTQFATVDEVKAAVEAGDAIVAPTLLPGWPQTVQPFHWIVHDKSGKSIVIEPLKGKLVVTDNPLGVLTNSPSFDWHMTNLRTYVNLSPFGLPDKKIGDLDLAPLGAGSGMIGLPGDNTPPSRFIRAVAWTQTARKTATADETVYEVFRIMDNFNLPLGPGAAEGHAGAQAQAGLMRSSTIWTAAWDLTNLKLYYHTQNNRRVRLFDIKAVDLGSGGIRHYPLDKVKAQDYEDVTPR